MKEPFSITAITIITACVKANMLYRYCLFCYENHKKDTSFPIWNIKYITISGQSIVHGHNREQWKKEKTESLWYYQPV